MAEMLEPKQIQLESFGMEYGWFLLHVELMSIVYL